MSDPTIRPIRVLPCPGCEGEILWRPGHYGLCVTCLIWIDPAGLVIWSKV